MNRPGPVKPIELLLRSTEHGQSGNDACVAGEVVWLDWQRHVTASVGDATILPKAQMEKSR